MKNKDCKYIISAILTLSLTTTIFASETKGLGEKLLSAAALTSSKIPNYYDKYIEETGEVVKIVNQNDFKRVLAKDEKGNITSYNIYPYTPVLDYDNVLFSPVVGNKIKVIYEKGTKSNDVNPPQVNADAVFVLDEGNSYDIAYDTFNKDLISHSKAKTLTISDTTLFLDNNMNPISNDKLGEEPLVVFYSVSSGKSPKKILAKKIIKLNSKPTKGITHVINEFIKSLDEEAIYKEGDFMYIRLSDVASKFGFKTLWNKEDSSVTLESEKSKYVFEIGNKKFVYNDTKGQFSNAPIIHDEKTYISYDFALDIMYKNYLTN